jgi:hypothetical protein
MFSKKESKQLREQFWTAFGKSYPRKWILYNTKLKGLSLKFHFELKKAMVSLDLEDLPKDQHEVLWNKLNSLKVILVEEYLEDVIYNPTYILDNQKEISRIYVQKNHVSIHDKSSWRDTMEFLNEKMTAMESFFEQYRDFLNP